jgi:catechol 2,3-dioxygenase-like lactoylglutathione lyase family enzyme
MGRPKDRTQMIGAFRGDPKMAAKFPTKDMELTQILVIREMDASRRFYEGVLGATVLREYGGTSCVLKFLGNWILLVTGGGPTEDKPTVTFAPPIDPDLAAHAMTIRVPDCRGAYKTLKERGAEFLTAPVDHGVEIRAFFRDPDGHLFEISEAV